jgi:hypothetical protein
MKTIGINDNNDIYLTPSGNLAVKSDLEAMGDILVNKAQGNRGELQYDTEKGVDYFNTIFSSPCYPDLFQAQLVATLEDTDEVQKVSDYSAKIDGDVYSYSVNITTSYGEVALNG